MYGYTSYYLPFPFVNIYSSQQSCSRFAYPAINTKIFSHSVKTFPVLMQQGRILLSQLANPPFAYKIMMAAQQGKKTQVEALVKSIGLTVPITTRYTPTGIIFTLHSGETQHDPEQCCSLSFSMKWGR